ncbi:MAG TPA: HIT domain-containing protein [Polyangiaceae bacterium]
MELAKSSLGLRPGDCVMCAVYERSRSDRVLENAEGVVVLDRFGSRHGHLLVISRAHLEGSGELGWERYAALQRLAFEATLALEATLDPARVFVAALGSSEPIATSYPHYHIHVVPIAQHDDDARPARVFSWSAGIVQYDEDERRELIGRLKQAHRERELVL